MKNRFIATKIVDVEPMTRGEYSEYRANQPDYDEYVYWHWQGYLVRDNSSAEKWIRKDKFEMEYRPVNAMTFGFALEALKRGEKVTRAGWGGTFIYLAASGKIEGFVLLPKGAPYIGLSENDILAEDWAVVSDVD